MKKIIFFLGLFTFLLSLFGFDPQANTYRLINADTLFIQNINDEHVTDLKGNVHFFYGNTEFFSDYAKIFEKKKISKLSGNVQVFDDTLSLFSDTAEYFRITDVIYLEDNVYAKETHQDSTYRTFEAQKVTYDRKKSYLHCENKVRVYDEKEDFHGKCGELYYYIEREYGYLIKSPEFHLAKTDSVSVKAEKIEYFKNYKKIAASFNVNTSSPDFTIMSNFLIYFSEQEKAIYLGKPYFSSDYADASSEEMDIFFQEKKLAKAVLIDSAKIYYKLSDEEKKENWVSAKNMTLFFKENNVSRCYAENDIDSFYIQSKKKNRDFTQNNVKGEKLVIGFDEDYKVSDIHLKNEVSGRYKFEKKPQ